MRELAEEPATKSKAETIRTLMFGGFKWKDFSTVQENKRTASMA
jgi:hypothetical protein